jgi:hypothetical protein
MTGNHVFQLTLDPDKAKKWAREDMVAIVDKKDKKDKRACGFKTTKESFSHDDIWTLLKKYDAQKALMSASIGKRADRATDGPAGEQMLEKEGLVAGHAYSIIAAKEVTERVKGLPKPGGKSFKLLQLRNPWGSYEWKGKWSDNSNMWKKHKSISNQLGNVAADDGTFWMEYNDFKKIYTRINVCDRDTARDASLDVNEDYGSYGILRGFCCGCFRFWCLCRGLRNLYFSHETTKETLDTNEKCCWIC